VVNKEIQKKNGQVKTISHRHSSFIENPISLISKTLEKASF
jgi:hypothetical protein